MNRIKSAISRHCKSFNDPPSGIVLGPGTWNLLIQDHPNLAQYSVVNVEATELGITSIPCSMNESMPKHSLITIPTKKRRTLLQDFINNTQEATIISEHK